MEDEHRPLVKRELAEGPLQLVSVREVLVVVDDARHLGREHANLRCPSSVAGCICVTRVNEDSEGPTLEVVDLSQVRELPPDRQQRVLQDVLGETRIAEDPPSDAQKGVTDLVHQVRERLLIAGAGSLYDFSIQPTLREAVNRPPVYP